MLLGDPAYNMATSEWESREYSSTDSDSSTESEKEVKRVATDLNFSNVACVR